MIGLVGCPSPTPPAPTVEVPQITAAASIAPLTLGTALPEGGIVIASKSGGGDIASCEVASGSTERLPSESGLTLKVNNGSCVITGTPTGTMSRTYNVKIVARNSAGISNAIDLVLTLTPAIGTLSLSLADGNFDSAQTLQITYNAVASETPTILYTSTTDGTEPADPSDSANNPTSYTLGTNIAILADANSRYRIRAIARRGSSTSAEITGTFTRFPANDPDGDGVLNAMDIDDDNDGLIEITGSTMAAQLTMLHNMRFNLAGTSYDDEEADTSPGDAGSTLGAPTSATANCSTGTDVDGDSNTPETFLCGYELTGNLSFDTGSDGTWSVDNTDPDAPVYTLDSADSASPYFVTASGGWPPIGTADTDGSFVAVFEGNGHSITGLAVQRGLGFVGMFGVIGAGAEIRNLGLVNVLADYSGSSGGVIYVGGLVGYQVGGQVTASYSTGSADGGAGDGDLVGGLVGYQNGGQVIASYSSGSADGGEGDDDYVGGLVGAQVRGQVTASYSTGSVDGGAGDFDSVGGLVGYQNGGQVIASYSSGNANGGAGRDYVGGLIGRQNGGQVIASYSSGNANGGAGRDYVGGLIGRQNGGQVTASYSTGSADGGAGANDLVGGLIGWQQAGRVTASYSSGNANGGDDGGDVVGSFIGWQSNRTTLVTASYGFGTATGETTSGPVTAFIFAGTAGIAGTNKPTGVTTPAGLTAANAGLGWNAIASVSAGAWNFGMKATANGGGPALNYADYDGTGASAYYCSGQTKPTMGTPIEIPNCGMLIPGQQ